MSNGFETLYEKCIDFEETLNNAILGAVACANAGQFDEGVNRWEKVITDKLDQIKLLNSKAVILNASLQKDNRPSSGLPLFRAQSRLCNALDTRLRWGNTLKAMAASKAVLDAFQERRHADMLVASDLLLKMAELQKTLNAMDSVEFQKEQALSAVIRSWQETAAQYKSMSSKASVDEAAKEPSEIEGNIGKLVAKLDTIGKIISRLMALSAGSDYDWAKDPGKLIPILAKYRRAPFTAESFL